MRFLIIFFLVSASFTASGQQASWIKNCETGLYDETNGKRIVRHPNGSVYVLGQMYGTNTFDGVAISIPPGYVFDDAFLARYALDGTLIWVKRLLDPTIDFTGNRVIDLKVDSQGDLLIVGFSFNPSSFLGAPPRVGAYIAKIDPDANLKWINYEADVNMRDADVSRRGSRIVIDQSDNVYWFCDQNFENGWSNYEGGLALIKYTPDGAKVWNKLLTQNSTYDHPLMSSITLDEAGNFVVSGVFFNRLYIGPYHFSDNSTNTVNRVQLFVASFTSDVVCRWAIQSNYGYSPSTASSHTIDSDGNIYLATNLGDNAQLGIGSSSFVNPGFSKGYLFRISPGGNIQWANPLYNVNTFDLAYGADGNIYLTGLYYSEMQYQSYRKATSISQSVVIKINRGGSFLGAFTSETLEDPSTPYGSDSYGYQSVVDANGDIYTMGAFREGLTFNCLPATTANYSFYLVKFEKPVVPPLVITGPNDSYCDAASLTLSATVIPGADYIWFIPDGATSTSPPTGSQINLNITSAANQRAVMVSVSDGCAHYFSEPYTLQISSRPGSPQFANAKSIVCAGTTETYSVQEVAIADQIEWTMPSEISATSTGQPSSMSLHFSESFLQGNITVTVKNQCGQSSSNYYISTYPTPGKPMLTGQEIICSNVTELYKTVSPVDGAVSYQWELPPFITQRPGYPQNVNSLYAQVFPQFESGEIQVRAIGQCDAGELSDPITISRKPKPGGATQLAGPDKICTTSNNVAYKVSPIPNATQYVWNVSGPFNQQGEIKTETNSLELKVTRKGAGSVTIYAMNECGEKGSSVQLDILSFEPLPVPKLEKSLCDSEIMVTLADTVQWFRNGIHLPGLYQKRLAVHEAGTYTVRAGNFCGEQESEPLDVLPVIESKVSIPNVVTPNGDGKNDFFELDRSLESSSLQITNRWGMEVYNEQHYLNQWTAQDISPGTYFYVLTNKCLSKPYRGWIHVLKE